MFAGDPLTPNLKALVQKLGISEKIIDLGKVTSETLQQLYKNAYALLFPSRFEGFGWPIIEGQALGTPVIAGNNSAIPEVAGKGAFLCDSEAIDIMVDELNELKSEGYRQQRIQAGYQNLERFQPQSFEEAYLELYRKITIEDKKIFHKKVNLEINSKEVIKSVKIVAFGGCMTGGYPFSRKESYFTKAIQNLSRNLNEHQIDEHHYIVNGCTFVQASVFMDEIIYQNKPDIAVIQFGMDTLTSVRSLFSFSIFPKKLNYESNQRKKITSKAHSKNLLKWKILGFFSSLLKIKPLMNQELYMERLLETVAECHKRGIKVIMMTPFCLGNSWSNRLSKIYSEEVEKASLDHSFICLNSWKALSAQPLEKILLSDGHHLSIEGHQILSRVLQDKIQELILTQFNK